MLKVPAWVGTLAKIIGLLILPFPFFWIITYKNMQYWLHYSGYPRLAHHDIVVVVAFGPITVFYLIGAGFWIIKPRGLSAIVKILLVLVMLFMLVLEWIWTSAL